VNVTDGDGLTCIVPPQGGDHWPFGASHDPNTPPVVPSQSSTPAPTTHQGISTGTKVGIAIGVIMGVLFIAILAWFIRRRAINRPDRNRLMSLASTNTGYT
jgi:hypothetical protein